MVHSVILSALSGNICPHRFQQRYFIYVCDVTDACVLLSCKPSTLAAYQALPNIYRSCYNTDRVKELTFLICLGCHGYSLTGYMQRIQSKITSAPMWKHYIV